MTRAKTRREANGYRTGIALVGTLLGLGAALGASAQTSDLVDLGPGVRPQDVNNGRDVVGSMTAADGSSTAFVYSLGGVPTAIDATAAWAVNDDGRIAGETATGAFVWDRGAVPLQWDDFGAFGASESGLVSGNVALDNPYRTSPRPVAPALYDGATWTYLDVARVYPRGSRDGIYADLFVLWDVNDAGVAVGSRQRSGLVGSSAIVTDPAFGSVEYLPIPYGGRASAINEQGQIVGATGEYSASGIFAHAFFYEAGVVTDLGTLGGLRSSASDINESGRVVGSSLLPGELSSIPSPDQQHAFVWEQGADMVDLNGLVDEPGWILTAASAINDAGDVVGTGLRDGQPHGFLLLAAGAPVPGPAPNEPPVAAAAADVTSGAAPLTVRFDASGSSDPDGWALTYSWQFGDGTFSTEPSPTHTYESPGSYLAVLAVTDQGGLGDSSSLEINVDRSRGRKKK